MARLVPIEENAKHLADARGWLNEDDPFFETINRIVKARSAHLPRILEKTDRV